MADEALMQIRACVSADAYWERSVLLKKTHFSALKASWNKWILMSKE